MPAAWMVSSNATEVTIDYFLKTIRIQNPNVIPRRIMSDKDRGQMNVIQWRYPESHLLLCWWHVLHAWQQHFVTNHYPELWDLMRKWVRMTNKQDFDTGWENIQTLAPPSLAEYLRVNWMNELELWSAVHRQDRTIYELCDTNMLVEAYVIFD
jgi:hypothetical protein